MKTDRLASALAVLIVLTLLLTAAIWLLVPVDAGAATRNTVHVTVTDQYGQPFPADDSVFVYLYKATWTQGKHYDEVRTGSPATFERVPSQDMLLLVIVYDNYTTPEGYQLTRLLPHRAHLTEASAC